MQIKVKKLNENAVLPHYAHYGTDMGADLTAIDYKYDPEKDRYIYKTGLAFEIPKGFGMLIVPRSSNGKTEAYLANHIGVIDSNYRGEVMFIYKLRTRRQDLFPGVDEKLASLEMENELAPYKIGDRIGQAIILPYPIIDYIESDELSETDRGEGGFGSTGN